MEAPLQGAFIGQFVVMAPSLVRYLDLVVDSNKTPEPAARTSAGFVDSVFEALKSATAYIKSVWGQEYFPDGPTSRENEMSVVQHALLNNKHVLLTGDAGREALQETIDYAPKVALSLPGINYFQVPHHGGRHNVSTEILDKLLGPRLPQEPKQTTWVAVCSSAKADEDHPRKSVIRAMMHRGAHWSATEGKNLRVYLGIERPGWVAVPQAEYPGEQED